MLKKIKIFTDGSCLGNPGPGGYGIILRYKQHEKELSAGFFLTTNNRMELLAAVIALETLKEPCEIIIITDSQYVQQGVTKWIYSWKQKNWRTANKKPVKNSDLWQRLDNTLNRHKIEWQWVKGHSGHSENERCDQLARKAAEQPTKIDTGYTNTL